MVEVGTCAVALARRAASCSSHEPLRVGVVAEGGVVAGDRERAVLLGLGPDVPARSARLAVRAEARVVGQGRRGTQLAPRGRRAVPRAPRSTSSASASKHRAAQVVRRLRSRREAPRPATGPPTGRRRRRAARGRSASARARGSWSGPRRPRSRRDGWPARTGSARRGNAAQQRGAADERAAEPVDGRQHGLDVAEVVRCRVSAASGARRRGRKTPHWRERGGSGARRGAAITRTSAGSPPVSTCSSW